MLNLYPFLTFIFSFSFSSCSQNVGQDIKNEIVPVLVISVESLRWDFVDRIRQLKNVSGLSSHLWQLTERGTYAPEGIQSTFSTTTIPNQQTLVTGLYQENHGVIGESIYDTKLNTTIDLKYRALPNDSNFRGEPIWKTALRESQGKHLVGCYAWFGCERADVNKSVPISQHADWNSVIDEVIGWLKEGLRLVLVSVPDIDIIGRLDGPESARMDDALQRLDDGIGYLSDRITQEMPDGLNLIILSGHGMVAARQDASILPADLSHFFRIWTETPTMWLVEPLEYSENETVAYFNQFEHLEVFTKRDIPDDWHYKNSPSVSPILILAEPGYALRNGRKGLYGYRNSVQDMRGSFIAYGPAFTANSVLANPTSVVDIYQLLCALLNIKPAPNDGSSKHFEAALALTYASRLSQLTNVEPPRSLIPVIVLSIILFVGIILGALLCYRSGECSRSGGAYSQANTAATNSAPDGQRPIGKYDSELVLLELDDTGVKEAPTLH